MGLDISIYNKDGTCTDVSEIRENLHYWLFNLAHLDKGRFRTIFRVQDYYLTDVELSGTELVSFINELKEIGKKSPYGKEIEQIVNCINLINISKIRITGD